MRMRFASLALLWLAGLALAGCGKTDEHMLQGWVEAVVISAKVFFVLSDEWVAARRTSLPACFRVKVLSKPSLVTPAPNLEVFP